MPNRLLKESIWTSPNLNKLPDDAELLFYRLIPLPDDHGCFEADPEVLKGKIFPKKASWTVQQICNQLVSLANNKVISLWIAEERLFGIFNKWKKHQIIRSLHRRKTPEPPNGSFNNQDVMAYLQTFDSNCMQLSVIECLNPNPNPNPNHNPKNQRHSPVDNDAKTVEPKSQQNSKPKEILSLYNKICTKLPKAQKLTKNRREKILMRLKENPEQSFWEHIFNKANETPFLCGKNKNNWTATLDWFITNDTNMIKVIEGSYDSQKHSGLKEFYEEMEAKQNGTKGL